MGFRYKRYFKDKGIYACKRCRTHFTVRSCVYSKHYTGKVGESYLVTKVVNYTQGRPEEREMRSGSHVVRDIFCLGCGEYIGWTYVKAYDPDNKFKEGMYIIEMPLITTIDES